MERRRFLKFAGMGSSLLATSRAWANAGGTWHKLGNTTGVNGDKAELYLKSSEKIIRLNATARNGWLIVASAQ